MDLKQKLIYLTYRGVKLNYIAKCAGCAPSTISEWMYDVKPASAKMQEKIRLGLEYVKDEFLKAWDDDEEQSEASE